jgi:hypothetical protein
MKKCSTGKRAYLSESMAEDALLEAHIRSEFAKGQGPVAVYQCNECGAFHLTSKGTLNPRLAKSLNDGTIGKMRAAQHWANKLQKRGG